MKYDLSQVFTDLDGTVILDKEKPFTLRAILALACINADPQKYADGDSKYRIYKLLLRIHAQASAVELSSEEVTLLKDLVGRIFAPYIVGLVYDVLEQKDDPTANS